jgi:hypothetical protein
MGWSVVPLQHQTIFIYIIYIYMILYSCYMLLYSYCLFNGERCKKIHPTRDIEDIHFAELSLAAVASVRFGATNPVIAKIGPLVTGPLTSDQFQGLLILAEPEYGPKLDGVLVKPPKYIPHDPPWYPLVI